MIRATDSVTTKDGEAIIIIADANTVIEVTGDYQPLNTSATTLADMPVLGIPQAVNTVNDQVLESQSVATLGETLYNVGNVVQTNTLGGTQGAFVRRGFDANWDGPIMASGLRTTLPHSFNAATGHVGILEGLTSTLHGVLDPGGLTNVVTKHPEEAFRSPVSATSSSFGGGTGQLDIAGPTEGTQLAYRLTGEVQGEDYWRDFDKERDTFTAPPLTWLGDNATVTILYSHRGYKTPFDYGVVFDLMTK